MCCRQTGLRDAAGELIRLIAAHMLGEREDGNRAIFHFHRAKPCRQRLHSETCAEGTPGTWLKLEQRFSVRQGDRLTGNVVRKTGRVLQAMGCSPVAQAYQMVQHQELPPIGRHRANSSPLRSSRTQEPERSFRRNSALRSSCPRGRDCPLRKSHAREPVRTSAKSLWPTP